MLAGDHAHQPGQSGARRAPERLPALHQTPLPNKSGHEAPVVHRSPSVCWPIRAQLCVLEMSTGAKLPPWCAGSPQFSRTQWPYCAAHRWQHCSQIDPAGRSATISMGSLGLGREPPLPAVGAGTRKPPCCANRPCTIPQLEGRSSIGCSTECICLLCHRHARRADA